MKKMLIAAATLGVLSAVFYGMVAISGATYSEGDRVGVVAKLGHRGLMMKTWEGELHMGSLQDGGVPRIWEFSVSDPTAIKKVQDAQMSGHRVSLHYIETLFSQPWKGDTSYFVTDVKSVE